MPYRVNGQYIMEGLASSFLFNIGGLGFVILDLTNNKSTPRLNKTLLTAVGFACIIVSFFTCWTFMRMKLPYVFIEIDQLKKKGVIVPFLILLILIYF